MFLKKISFITFALILTSASAAFCEDPLPPLQITAAQLQQISDALPRTKAAMVLTHWTAVDTWLRWSAQGEIYVEEFKNLVGNSEHMVAGGGFYIASDSNSSRGFGDYGLKAYIPKGTPIYDEEIVKKILGLEDPLEDQHRSELGQMTEFIYQSSKTESRTWWVTYSHSLLTKRAGVSPLKSARISRTPLDFGGGKYAFKFKHAFEYLRKLGAQGIYAKRLLTILYSENIHGFLKAIYETPENLEKILSNKQMDRVEAGMEKWIFRTPQFAPLLDMSKTTKEQWVQNQLNLFKTLFTDFTGLPQTEMFRKKLSQSPLLTLDPYQTEALRQNKALSL